LATKKHKHHWPEKYTVRTDEHVSVMFFDSRVVDALMMSYLSRHCMQRQDLAYLFPWGILPAKQDVRVQCIWSIGGGRRIMRVILEARRKLRHVCFLHRLNLSRMYPILSQYTKPTGCHC
jgi:hypothetical protein